MRQIAGTIGHPHHLHGVVDQAIQNQPTFNNERTGISGEVWPRPTNFRMLCQKLAALFDAIVNLVRDGLGIARRDIELNIQQVFASAACKSNPARAHALDVARRARFLLQRFGVQLASVATVDAVLPSLAKIAEFFRFLLLDLFHQAQRLADDLAR